MNDERRRADDFENRFRAAWDLTANDYTRFLFFLSEDPQDGVLAVERAIAKAKETR